MDFISDDKNKFQICNKLKKKLKSFNIIQFGKNRLNLQYEKINLLPNSNALGLKSLIINNEYFSES